MIKVLFTILGIFALNTANTTLVIDAPENGEAGIVYYGPKIGKADMEKLAAAGYHAQGLYPAYGLKGTTETAIAVTQADGNKTLKLDVCSVEEGSWEGGRTLTVISKDPAYPITVRNVFRSFEEQDMIETWAEVTNEAKATKKAPGTVVLNRFDSGCLPIRVGDVWISSIYGTWANEGRVATEKLERGYKVIKNIDGVRNSHTSHSEVMISLDGKPEENSGRVIGAALEWGGDYELRFQTNDSDYHHFFAGILPENNEYNLEAGETFKTPALAYTFSDEGLSGVSRNFHHWGRRWRMAHGDVERKVLLNSWEGVYFDINEPGMDQMMGDIASMGGELFVMDDGWFGDKYPRLNDHSSLGDWVVDKNKLPNGIGWLVKQADAHGISFGIWIEPEMTNNPSELYEAHPDWVLKADKRDNVYGRGDTQLVLDLCNPAVQDYIFSIVDNLMKENPDIDYIKWDSNMDMRSRGSQYIKHQSHLDIEYWRGFEAVCNRIRAAYPDLTIQACASGGGRANWGVLPWFDEFWVSDNTDALQRVYMQWGTSYFFPAIAMASHISATPNHTVHRTTSIKYRIDVAMSGRLGMEIQPKNMTEQEKDICRKAIAEYKQIRPIVQFGDIYRLVSPYDGKGFASMMHIAEDKSAAVFYWWRIANFYDEHFARVQMKGLDPERMYKVHELNRIDGFPLRYEGMSFSGRFLMENGLEIPSSNFAPAELTGDWSSRVLYLEAE
ncbi:MAG: alpha-galactosidase [Bacteroidales bacterium]|nr:alpha-galactosidase [Bacteroidales bacterium]